MKRRGKVAGGPVRGGAPGLPVLAAVLAIAAAVAGGCRAGRAAAPERHVVEIERFVFRPDTLRVSVGDTVVWLNRDVVPHTATDSAKAWDSGILGKDATWRMVPTEPGAHRYVCALHPTMKAVLIVEE